MPAARRQALGLIGAALGAGMAGSRLVAAAPLLTIEAGQRTQGGWARGTVRSDAVALTLDEKPVAFDAQGRFLIAFDRDAQPQALLTARFASGDHADWPLTIAPRQWDIEHVDAPFHPPGLPDAEFARFRAGELAQIAAARAMETGARGWLQDFHWPLTGRISGHFGAQRIFRDPDGTLHPAAYHPGLDIAVPIGTPYAAPADGVVILAAEQAFTLEGHLLMVDHGMGLNSAYLHGSQLLVKVGDRVRQGQVLGLSGMTGRATGPHLHWALKWREARLDPLLFVGPMA